MMKLVRYAVTLFTLSVLLGAGESLVVDPARTKVEFTLPSLLHTVHGEFQLKRGALHFDPQTGALGGELVVDAASGDSGNSSRDKRMHSAILESARYPEITFRPDRVDGQMAPAGKSQVQLHGIFGIHGADHEIVMPATVDAAGGYYTVDATCEIPYVKWGMKNPSTLFLRVSDKVDVHIHTRVTAAAATPHQAL
ncbi:MAG: YceI family protein [Candidatus Solibacter sp.]